MTQVRLRTSTEADHPAIASLMSSVFGTGHDHPTVRPDHFRWKYLVPRSDYAAERAWIVEQDGEIVAHIGVWPLWIRTLDGPDVHEIPALHGFDWTAKADVAGAGALVLKKAIKVRGAACVAGGSDGARPMFQPLGFRTTQVLTHWARPTRPLKQAINRREREVVFLPRNLFWRYWPPLKVADWRVEQVAPEAMPEALWPRPEPGLAVFRRSAALFRYLADCPITPVRLYRSKGPEAEGYFCLSRVPGVAKIIDAWTPSTSIDDWAALYASAYREAMTDPEVCEVSTLAGIARANEALRRIGFRRCGDIDFRLAERAGVIQAGREYHFQWVDNDKGIWHRNRRDYRT